MMKSSRAVGTAFIIASLIFGASACSTKDRVVEKADNTKPKVASTEEVKNEGFQGKYMVTGEYVKEHQYDKQVLLVDARGWKQAALGTLKGAIATTWNDLCTCQEGEAGDENWGKIPEASELARRLGELGITKDKEIITIADTINGWGDDARIVWELVAAGYQNVKMIDGGYQAAKHAGADTQLFASNAIPKELTIDRIDTTHVMTTEELQEHYEEYTILDVRTEEEYNGAVLHNEAKGGRLKGAIHFAYTDLFQEDGRLKSNQEIESMCEAAGLKKEDKIVTYCTGGIRSAYTQLVLQMCGYEHTWNYDQSYWRWCMVGEVE